MFSRIGRTTFVTVLGLLWFLTGNWSESLLVYSKLEISIKLEIFYQARDFYAVSVIVEGEPELIQYHRMEIESW